MNTGGFGPKGYKNRQGMLQNQMALQKAQAEGAGIQNQLAQKQLAQTGMPMFKQVQGRDGQTYQVQVDRMTGQIIGEPKLVGAAAPSDPFSRALEGTRSGGASMPRGSGVMRPGVSQPQSQGGFNAPPPFQPTADQEDLMRFMPDMGASVYDMPPRQRNAAFVAARQAKAEAEKKQARQLTPIQMEQKKRWEAEDNRKQAEFEAEQAAANKEKAGAVEFAGETLELVRDMLNPQGVGAGLEGSVGTLQGSPYFPSIKESTVNFDNAHNQLKARLTKENLGIMKGVLSDNDIRILQDIGTGRLNLRSGEDAYKAELVRIGEKMMFASGVTEDDIKTTMEEEGLTREEVIYRVLGVQ
jgi:hypothetical protein